MHNLRRWLGGLALATCLVAGARADIPPRPPPDQVADLWTALHGIWVGQADPSPLGKIPYALKFTTSGDDVAAETPPPPGGVLPKGAYQRFVFGKAKLTYKASLGDGFVEGSLDAHGTPARDEITYCTPEASGGCDAMMVKLSLGEARAMIFDTWIKKELHSHITLKAVTK